MGIFFRIYRHMGRLLCEWPTLLLLLCFWLSFLLVTYFTVFLPWWLVMVLGGYLVCLHGSLQHEALHGHPTRNAYVNEALIFPVVSLWLNYRRYRMYHLRHHRDDYLTDPFEDPESYYWARASWLGLPFIVRIFLHLNNTLLGRLIFSLPVSAGSLIFYDMGAILRGDWGVLKDWVVHFFGVLVVLFWVMGVCGIDFWSYLFLYVWPGAALMRLRSFAEHRAHHDVRGRSVVIESNPIMSLLYLNNNLHAVHHHYPSLAWYRLPSFYSRCRSLLWGRGCDYRIDGYASLLKHYLFCVKEPVIHPFIDRSSVCVEWEKGSQIHKDR